MNKTLDQAVAELVQKHGLSEVVAALARHCHENGFNPTAFRRLNKIYEWLTRPADVK